MGRRADTRLREAARTAALYAPAAVVIASSWLLLEEGRASAEPVALFVVLALLPALVRPVRLRAAAAVLALLAAASAALDVSPLDARPFHERDFFGPALSRLRDGILAFYDVNVPFAAGGRPLMHAAVLLAIFSFCLAVGLAAAARRPLAAGLALVVGSVWPATLVSAGSGVARGLVILGALLALLAWGGVRPARSHRQVAVAGIAIVLVAAVVGGSPAVAKGEFLDWKRWDAYDRPEAPVGVEYVWDGN